VTPDGDSIDALYTGLRALIRQRAAQSRHPQYQSDQHEQTRYVMARHIADLEHVAGRLAALGAVIKTSRLTIVED
jgi:hypothetical protein